MNNNVAVHTRKVVAFFLSLSFPLLILNLLVFESLDLQPAKAATYTNCSIEQAELSLGLRGHRGNSSDPFQIKTDDDLNCMRELVNNNIANGFYRVGRHWEVQNDIDLTTVSSAFGSSGWIPIGTSANYFFGYVYGKPTLTPKPKLTGMNIHVAGAQSEDSGLFGHVRNSSFSHLAIDQFRITGNTASAGLLAGSSAFSLTVQDVSATGLVNIEADRGGGLIGVHSDGPSTITDASVSVDLTSNGEAGILAGGVYSSKLNMSRILTNGKVTAPKNDLGGAIGKIFNSDAILIQDVTNSANVSGTGSNGGIVGQIYASHGSISAQRLNNYGKVVGTSTDIGGIFGVLQGIFDISLSQLTNHGDVSSGSYAGGIASRLRSWGNLSLVDLSNSGVITGTEGGNVGGIVGSVTGDSTLVRQVNNYGNLFSAGSSSSFYAGGVIGEFLPIWSNESVLLDHVNNFGNIKFSHGLVGGIDGTVSNVSMTLTHVSNYGEITHTGEPTETTVGGIVGRLVGSQAYRLEDVHNWGEIKAEGCLWVGGIYGYDYASSMHLKNVSNHGNITGSDNVGGLISWTSTANPLSIEQAANFGDVTAHTFVAGIAARMVYGAHIEFSKVANFGKISASDTAGGVIGHLGYPNITNSSNMTEVINLGDVITSYARPGGLVGLNEGNGVRNYQSAVNLDTTVSGTNEVNALVEAGTNFSKMYRWAGTSSHGLDFAPFVGDNPESNTGAPVNCSDLAQASWWIETAGFTEQAWDFSKVNQGYAPIPKDIALADSNLQGKIQEPIPFHCFTSVTTSDVHDGVFTPSADMTTTFLTSNPNTRLYRYKANLTNLVYQGTPTAKQVVSDLTLSKMNSQTAVSFCPESKLVLATDDLAKPLIADQSLSAFWGERAFCYSVNFDANGGQGTVDSASVRTGEAYTLPAAGGFVRTGYTLTGWNSDSNAQGQAYALGASVVDLTEDLQITLYAQWQADPVPSPDPTDTPTPVIPPTPPTTPTQPPTTPTQPPSNPATHKPQESDLIATQTNDHISIAWNFPGATGFSANYEYANALSGFDDAGTLSGVSGSLDFGQKFAGNYIVKVRGTVSYADGTTDTYVKSTTLNLPLAQQKDLKSVSFVDVNSNVKTIKYDGSNQMTKLAPVTPARQASIQWLAAFGVTVGSGGSGGKIAFKPQDPVNRGAMAQFLQKLAGFTDSQIAAKYSTASSKFTDINHLLPRASTSNSGNVDAQKPSSNSHPLAPNPARYYAILWLADTGITAGCNDRGTQFCPNKTVNRGAMAQFLQKLAGFTDSQIAAKYSTASTKFTDLNYLLPHASSSSLSSSSTHNSKSASSSTPSSQPNLARYYSILWLADIGITLGCNSGGTKFCPNDIVTRGAMAQFMHKLAFAVGSTRVKPM